MAITKTECSRAAKRGKERKSSQKSPRDERTVTKRGKEWQRAIKKSNETQSMMKCDGKAHGRAETMREQ